MTQEEYMEEHGDDLMFDGVDTERVVGECAACGGDFTNYDEGFYGTEDIRKGGKTVGQREIYVHDDCLIDYLNLNTTHDQVAEFLRLKKIGWR